VHILVVTSWFPRPGHPYGGIFIKRQIQALIRSGVEIGVIYPEKRALRKYMSRDEDYVSNQFLEIRFPVYSVDRIHTKLHYKEIKRKTQKAYKKYVDLKGVPDIILAHSSLYGGVVAKEISGLTGIEYYMLEHSSLITMGQIDFKKIIEDVLGHAKKVIAVSNFQGLRLDKEYDISKNKIEVLNNHISGVFESNERLIETPKIDFRIVSVGSFRPIKNYKNLIKAFAKFSHLNCQLRIIGSGPMAEEYVALSQQLGVDKKVVIEGPLAQEEILSRLLSSHMYVCSSHTETFGISLIEALSVGLPILTTSCGGPMDYVNNENGHVVGNSVGELAEGIDFIYSNYSNFNVSEIATKTKNRFSSERHVNDLLKIIND